MSPKTKQEVVQLAIRPLTSVYFVASEEPQPLTEASGPEKYCKTKLLIQYL